MPYDKYALPPEVAAIQQQMNREMFEGLRQRKEEELEKKKHDAEVALERLRSREEAQTKELLRLAEEVDEREKREANS